MDINKLIDHYSENRATYQYDAKIIIPIANDIKVLLGQYAAQHNTTPAKLLRSIIYELLGKKQ